MSKPKILIYDIETAPMLGYVWSLWDNNVALNQLAKDWHVMSWAAKWLDDNDVYYEDQRDAKNIENDKAILKPLHKMLTEADATVTHNGISFDAKKLNARFFKHGMPPIGKKIDIDTKRLASKKFGFTSNKLEYLTHNFCETKKLKRQKYAGFELWKECLAGNPEAWDEMADYNIADVLSLEELYLKMAPWDERLNYQLFSDNENTSRCGHGTHNLVKKGFSFTGSGKYQKYQCKKCGKWSRDKTNLLEKSKRKSLHGGA